MSTSKIDWRIAAAGGIALGVGIGGFVLAGNDREPYFLPDGVQLAPNEQRLSSPIRLGDDASSTDRPTTVPTGTIRSGSASAPTTTVASALGAPARAPSPVTYQSSNWPDSPDSPPSPPSVDS